MKFWVPGKPQPGGSKTAISTRVVIDSNPKAKGWKQTVAGHAIRAVGKPQLKGPVAVEFTFHLLRPLAHFVGRKRGNTLRADAPEWPTVKPDALKLSRTVEDALTGILYADDAQIVVERLVKRYGEEEGVQVEVRAI